MNEDRLNDQENYRTEYKEVAATYRFQISLRFIVNAFTATSQSALFSLYDQALQRTQSSGYTIMIPFIGIIMMAAIFIIEYRTISVFREMIKRGKELEFNLGLIGGHFGWLGAPKIINPKGCKKFITHTWGIRLIYGVILVMWIVFLITYFTN